jgi:hypothetical protein
VRIFRACRFAQITGKKSLRIKGSVCIICNWYGDRDGGLHLDCPKGAVPCPLHLYRHIRFPAWDPVIDPYIPLFLQVNKWTGITVKNAEEWVFSLYYFSKGKKWEAEVCVLEGVSYEARSTRDETGWAVRFFSLLFFINEKMRKCGMCLWEHEMWAPEFVRCYNQGQAWLHSRGVR